MTTKAKKYTWRWALVPAINASPWNRVISQGTPFDLSTQVFMPIPLVLKRQRFICRRGPRANIGTYVQEICNHTTLPDWYENPEIQECEYLDVEPIEAEVTISPDEVRIVRCVNSVFDNCSFELKSPVLFNFMLEINEKKLTLYPLSGIVSLRAVLEFSHCLDTSKYPSQLSAIHPV